MDNSQFSLFSLHPSWKEKQIKLVPNYDIETYIQPITKKMNIKKNKHIFLCIYNIEASEEYLHTHLKYFLYKQPDNDNKFSNLVTFPYVLYTSGDPLKIAEKTIKNIFTNDMSCKGFVEEDNNLYLFYQYTDDIPKHPNIRSDNNYWWGLIDEICNKKEIINYPIHDSVCNLFLNNPGLIYLTVFYDNIKHKLEIPVVAYSGEYYKLINENFELVDRTLHSMFGPYYIFSDSFTKSLRYACWTNNYKPAYFNKEKITNENGRYIKSKIVRVALFLGNSNVVRTEDDVIMKKIINNYDNNEKKYNMKSDKKYTYKWKKNIDSLLIGKIPFKKLDGYFNYVNRDIIVKTKDRFIPLSIHDVDVNSLGPFHNSNYTKYKIL